jgi:hypothetical protein
MIVAQVMMWLALAWVALSLLVWAVYGVIAVWELLGRR